ncbi:hypothetical protein IJH29_00100 [Candidatus Saccharibacteria bacterium]|nr:hypothetical protein [Candidatus Saccharibacteria bacterium]
MTNRFFSTLKYLTIFIFLVLFTQTAHAEGNQIISSDDGFLLETDGLHMFLELNNYNGEPFNIKCEDPVYSNLFISLKGINTITGEEYALKTDCNYTEITSSDVYPMLYLIANSSTNVANGFISTGRSLKVSGSQYINIKVNSALPLETPSTSEVTGISLLSSEPTNVRIDGHTTLTIYNPTGSFGIYADTFTDQLQYPDEPNLSITHKYYEGVGNAFSNNDFEDYSLHENITAGQPYYTFSHPITNHTPTFRLVKSIPGVAVTFNKALSEGQDLSQEEERIVKSLTLDKAYKAEASPVSTYHGKITIFDDSLYQINYQNTYLICYNNCSNDNTVAKDGFYFLKVNFIPTSKDYGFIKPDYLGPWASAYFNGEETSERAYVSSNEIFYIVGLEVTPKDEAEEPEEPEVRPYTPVLPTIPDPKDPETSEEPVAQPETPIENPDTSTGNPAIFSILFVASFVIQCTYYGKVIFSVRRHGLRQNHATPSGRL